MMMHVDIFDHAHSDLLAGTVAGKALLPAFEALVERVPDGSLLVLDFERVALVTSSFFIAAFERLWISPVVHEREIFPVLANVNTECRDEMELALKARGRKALFGSWQDGSLLDVVPFTLDRDELETYDKVAKMGEATASDLFRDDSRILPTGWSNRLSLLHGYRLLRRRKQGRQLYYSLAWR